MITSVRTLAVTTSVPVRMDQHKLETAVVGIAISVTKNGHYPAIVLLPPHAPTNFWIRLTTKEF